MQTNSLKLPLLIFYENHLTGSTFPVLTKLLPVLKLIGYDNICYEPELLAADLEDEVVTLTELQRLAQAPDIKLTFLKQANQINIKLSRIDLPVIEFKNHIKFFFTKKKIIDNQLSNLIDNTNASQFSEQLTEYLLDKGFPAANILTLLNQLMLYLAAGTATPYPKEAKKFFEKRTGAMSSQSCKIYQEANGVLTINGYRHILHHDFEKKEIKYIAFFCKGINLALYQNCKIIDKDNLPEQVLDFNKVNHISAENPEISILKILLEALPDKESIITPFLNKFEEEEENCCNRIFGCTLS